MKLPKWLVVSMLALSALAVLLIPAAIIWWAIWPERTLREFESFVVQGKVEDANRLLANAHFHWKNVGPDRYLVLATELECRSPQDEAEILFFAPDWERYIVLEDRSDGDFWAGTRFFTFRSVPRKLKSEGGRITAIEGNEGLVEDIVRNFQDL